MFYVKLYIAIYFFLNSIGAFAAAVADKSEALYLLELKKVDDCGGLAGAYPHEYNTLVHGLYFLETQVRFLRIDGKFKELYHPNPFKGTSGKELAAHMERLFKISPSRRISEKQMPHFLVQMVKLGILASNIEPTMYLKLMQIDTTPALTAFTKLPYSMYLFKLPTHYRINPLVIKEEKLTILLPLVYRLVVEAILSDNVKSQKGVFQKKEVIKEKFLDLVAQEENPSKFAQSEIEDQGFEAHLKALTKLGIVISANFY